MSRSKPASLRPSSSQRLLGKPSGIVTLLTDFGTKDPFVGVMKGVLITRFSAVQLVDLTHEITPQNVAEASFWLSRSYGYFPLGTVHVAVVDPDVGTPRRVLAVRSANHMFLAPDNGLLSGVLQNARRGDIRSVDIDQFALPARSSTFHGRDVFAPTAAALASGQSSFTSLGPPVWANAPPVQIATPVVVDKNRIRGYVVTVDHYGNLLTNIEGSFLPKTKPLIVRCAGHNIPLCNTYADVAPGELVAVLNGFDVVEISVREGSAQKELAAKLGSNVTIDR